MRRVINYKAFVKYINEEKCVDCVHCERLVSKEPEYVCKKFGIKNLVTGSVSYQEAGKCRDNQYQCSTFGIYFDRKIER